MKQNSESGQIVLMVTLLMPFFVLLIAFVVNISLLVHQKLRLQNAADAGVYSATASLARDLNRITFLNYNVQQLHDGDPTQEDLEVTWGHSFTDWNQGEIEWDENIAKFFVTEYKTKYNKLWEQVQDINTSAVARARANGEVAALLTFYNGNEALADLNPNSVRFASLYNKLGDTMTTLVPQVEAIEVTYVKTGPGVQPLTNASEGTSLYKANINIPFSKNETVRFVGRVNAQFGFNNLVTARYHVSSEHYLVPSQASTVGFAPEFMSSQLQGLAYAAGQPYGGSVEGFVQTYRAALIPIGNNVRTEQVDHAFYH